MRLVARFLFPELALATDEGAGFSIISQFAGSPFPSRDVEKISGNSPSFFCVKSIRISSALISGNQIVPARKIEIKRNIVEIILPKEKRAASATRLKVMYIYASNYSFQIMSATVCPAGINGSTCSV